MTLILKILEYLEQNKTTKEVSDIILEHNSVVLFSTTTNQEYLHQIIFKSKTSNVLWLGITFRQSKTFIIFDNELPYFSTDKKRLLLANTDQRKQLYRYKNFENTNVEYTYPDIDYTISTGDMISIL